MGIIDAHTHIFTKKVYDEYFSLAKGRVDKAIVLIDPTENPHDSAAFVRSCDNLYLVGNVDTDKAIAPQLQKLERELADGSMLGIKVYPGYEHFYPYEEKIWPIAEMCMKYDRPLVFHSGSVYDPSGKAKLKYALPIHLDDLAVDIPDLKIVMAHLGFPDLLIAAEVIAKNENVYGDISGTISVSGAEVAPLVREYVRDLKRVFNYYPDVKDKVMFGTDFIGKDSPLCVVNPYIGLVEKIFSGRDQERVFSETAKKVYFNGVVEKE